MKRKKLMVIVLSFILILSFVLTACGGGNTDSNDGTITPPPSDNQDQIEKPSEPETPTTKQYTLYLIYNSTIISQHKLDENTNISSFLSDIDEPQKAGFIFDGWFVDERLTIPLNNTFTITKDTNIYAKYLEINKLSTFDTAFGGIIKNGQLASVKDEYGVSLTKEYVLDRQFSILAENLLFSLANVYGVNLSGRTDAGQDYYKFNLQYDNKAYSHYGSNAVFNKSDLIMNESEIENGHVGHTAKNVVMVDCVACHAEFFWQNIPSQDHGFASAVFLSKAINGGMAWNEDTNRFYENVIRNQDAWQWGYDEGKNLNITTQAVEYVKGYVNKYKDKLKLELAKIVSGDSTVNNYEEQLELINHAGFTTNEKGKIETLVKNKIIGSSLISIDDSRIPEDKNVLASSLWTEENHYYKAYSVLVPCIVAQALNKTFENTAQSIYPFVSFETMKQENANKFTLEAGKSVYLEISDSVNIGALAINSNIATQIIVDVCNNGKVSSSKFNINALNNYVNLPGGAQTIGAFNGKLNLSDNLYQNNNPIDIQTGKLKENEVIGKNYIKITNNKSTTVELEISGYLEKWFKEGQIIE